MFLSDPSALLCTCAACPDEPVASRGRLVQATAIVKVPVEHVSYPAWWQVESVPPPAQWAYVFEDLTGEDSAEQWALGAAIFVAQTRRRTSRGPTFAELFTHLLPDTTGLPGSFPPGLDFAERRRVISAFRGLVAIEWRRRGIVGWDRDVMRSLRVGRVFREFSRLRQLERTAADLHGRRQEMAGVYEDLR